MTVKSAERRTRAWLESFVVGLDLCPFARPLLHADNLRIATSAATGPEDIREVFLRELDLLQRSTEQEIATTLVVYPLALTAFDDYLDFLDEAQALVLAAGLDDMVQLASFHPDYRFAGEDDDGPGNFSNRAPYPIIHLLRENMLTRVLADFPEPEQIPLQNVRRLEALGTESLKRAWQQLFES